MTDPTCQELVRNHYKGRMATIRTLWSNYCEDPEQYCEEGRWDEFGLSLEKDCGCVRSHEWMVVA